MNPVALIQTIKVNLLRRPLWRPETISDCLDMSRREILAHIERGGFFWAFNLASGTKSRSEPRILAACVIEKSLGTIPAIGATRNLNLPSVVNLILPNQRASLRGVELQRLFSVGMDLIRDLSRSGEIKRVAEKLPAVGPNSSPRFTRASVANLLERRRMK